MDKTNKDGTEKEVTQQSDAWRMVNVAVPQNRMKMINDLLKDLETSKEDGMSLLAKYDRSIIVNNKRFIPYFVNLINISYEAIRECIISACALEYLNMKIELLEKAIGILAEKTDKTNKNWEEVTAKLKQLEVDSPVINNVNSFIEELKKKHAEYDKKREENDLAT